LWDGWARQVGWGYVCVKLVPRSLPARALTSCTGRLLAAHTRGLALPRGPALPQGPPGPVILDPARDSLRAAPETGSRCPLPKNIHAHTQRPLESARLITEMVRRVNRFDTGKEEGVDWQKFTEIYETSRNQKWTFICRWTIEEMLTLFFIYYSTVCVTQASWKITESRIYRSENSTFFLLRFLREFISAEQMINDVL